MPPVRIFDQVLLLHRLERKRAVAGRGEQHRDPVGFDLQDGALAPFAVADVGADRERAVMKLDSREARKT